MADSKKVTFDFSLITKLLVGCMLVFMGIAGFISTRGTSFTHPLFSFLGEEAFIYIVSGLVAVAGLGILMARFLPGLPSYIGTVSGIIAVVFWLAVVFFKDIAEIGDAEFIDFIQSIAVDLIILIAVIQSTVLSKK